ncbi:hypothetical protein B0H11DRAFT_1077907 [Mycena galericulata]|nr:hypothetical protein B0H11DRAFT_1077907 [Mycena galericulata]
MLEELQDNVAVNVIPVCRPHHTKTDFFVLGHPHRPPQLPYRFASTPPTSCSRHVTLNSSICTGAFRHLHHPPRVLDRLASTPRSPPTLCSGPRHIKTEFCTRESLAHSFLLHSSETLYLQAFRHPPCPPRRPDRLASTPQSPMSGPGHVTSSHSNLCIRTFRHSPRPPRRPNRLASTPQLPPTSGPHQTS